MQRQKGNKLEYAFLHTTFNLTQKRQLSRYDIDHHDHPQLAVETIAEELNVQVRKWGIHIQQVVQKIQKINKKC